MKDVMKIALGVASGLVIAGIVWLIISAYIVKTAAEEITKASQTATAQIQKNAEATAQKQREHQARIEAEQRKTKAQELKARQAIIEAEQAAIKLRAAKAEAWRNFFTKSPECENPPTMNVMSNCANVAIRAKHQFEEQWNASHSTNTQVLPPSPKPIPLQADGSLPPGFEPYTPPGGIKRYGAQ
ncbi:MAG: hypothetical protein HYS19_05170 [Nitrosomonadales bacterium]|nr:hypothetical protein [Nitrosomonadales bacterium]